MLRSVLPVVLLVLSFAAHGQLYKWVDKDGKVQYTDQPPPPGAARDEKKLNIKSSPAESQSKSGDKTAAPKNVAEQELEFQIRRIAREQEESKQQAAETTNQRNCAISRNRLNDLESSGRLVTRNEKGERIYLAEADREKVIEQARKNISIYCK